jgi:acylphosphatase
MIHVIISGDVQGVGFRQFIRYQARKLNINGWVRNLPDGSVEAVYIGNKENVNKLIKISKHGPFLAKVEKVDIENVEEVNFNSFEIIKE